MDSLSHFPESTFPNWFMLNPVMVTNFTEFLLDQHPSCQIEVFDVSYLVLLIFLAVRLWYFTWWSTTHYETFIYCFYTFI